MAVNKLQKDHRTYLPERVDDKLCIYASIIEEDISRESLGLLSRDADPFARRLSSHSRQEISEYDRHDYLSQ